MCRQRYAEEFKPDELRRLKAELMRVTEERDISVSSRAVPTRQGSAHSARGAVYQSAPASEDVAAGRMRYLANTICESDIWRTDL